MRVSFLVFYFLVSISIFAQSTFVSVQDGDWNDASTWTLGAGAGGVEGVDYPSSSDIVTVNHDVIINATNSGSNFSFTGSLTINATHTLQSQVGNNVAGFVLEGDGLMINNGNFYTLDASETPDQNAKIPYEFVCKDNSVFIGGLNSFAFISDDWNIQDNAQIFIDNLNCYAVSDDVILNGANCFMYGNGNIRIGGDGINSQVEFNGGATVAQLDDDITIWNNTASLACGAPGTAVTTGTNAGNIPPFAFNDVFTSGINVVQNQTVLTQGTKKDFSPISGDVITLTSVGSNAGATNGLTTQGGTVSVNNNGTPGNPADDYVVYTPALGFGGVDSYNYLITNVSGGTAIATVTVTIETCGSGFGADTTYTFGVFESSLNGVTDEAEAAGAPDGAFAQIYDNADQLILDMGQIYSAGTQYQITWRIKTSASGTAIIDLSESTLPGSGFTPHPTSPSTTENVNFITTTVTSNSSFRYIAFDKGNSSTTDYDLDAVAVLNISCFADNDDDGIADGIDIDDDNDGIKDGDENNCASSEAYWTFDNTTDDASPNNHDERTTGSPPTFSTDAIQGTHSASFDASLNQEIRYSQDGAFMETAGTQFSFSAWIKPTNLSGIRVLFEEGGGVNGWIVYLEAGVPKVAGRVGGAGSQSTIASSVTLTVDGQWHHVAGTYNAGVFTVFVDGVSNSTTAGFAIIPTHTSDGGVGGIRDDNPLDLTENQGNYDGLMDAAKYSDSKAWTVNEIGFQCDNDGDGILDQFDLDSDNDGISDLVEAGGEDTNGDGKVDDISGNNLTNDSDNDGMDDRYDSDNGGTAIVLIDTDGDGIFNLYDLDSDNDGIADIVEEGGTDVNGDGRADNFTDIDSDGFNDVLDGDVGNDGFTENSANALVLTDQDGDNDGAPDSALDEDKDGDGIINRLDLDSDNDGIPDVVEQGGTDANGDGRADNFTDSDEDGFNDAVDGDPTNVLVVGSDAAGANTVNALLITGADTDGDGIPNSIPNGNLDQDGVYNFLDLDSDNDGILDNTESGGTDANTDGIEDAFIDADNDGFNDNVDGDPDNFLLAGTDILEAESVNALIITSLDGNNDGSPDSYPNGNFDGDGNLNFLDIDSDNDGIVDNTEGQPTTVAFGYILPAGIDSDNDGIDDAYDADNALFGGAGSGYTLIDSDATFDPGSPDYLDVDSDSDGDLDEIEGHDTDNDGFGDVSSPSNLGVAGGTADADGDGLLDGYDNNFGSTDPTNSNLLGESHPNQDNSGTAERDWREALDTDNDGIANPLDEDDDNDGIPDIIENSNNCLNPNVAFVNIPVAFWSLDNNTNDISGNNNNQGAGTILPTYSTRAVQGSHSANFNGAQGVRYSVDGGFMESDYTEISFSAWIIPDNLSGTRVIYEEGAGTHGSVLWMNGNVLTYTTRVSSTQVNVTHQNLLVLDNSWHHVAATYDNGVMTVYLDGVPSTLTPTNNTNIPPHGSDGGIGSDFGGTSANITGKFSGLMDAARYSNSEAWTAGSIATEAQQFCSVDADGDGILNQFDLDSDNDGIQDIVEAGGVDTDGDGRVDGFVDTDGDGWANTFDPDDLGTPLADGDQDGDGISNRIDLDSDNDGIQDILEAGGVDANGDGKVDVITDTDNDGYADTFDSDNGGVALTVPDTDGDGFANYLDLDSDSDGIIDNIEGQLTFDVGPTLGFRLPLGLDTDLDGWDNQYDSDDGGTSITLSNNDGTGDPDYIDLNSDDDAQPDWLERADDDEDGDALLDLIALADAYEVANGNPSHYVSSDDADLDGIPDFLESAGALPAFLTPGNGLYRDSDNDGLVDFYDADSNGDNRDNVNQLVDADNDGEYDFRDSDNDVTLPIELIEFKATIVGAYVQLDWSTAAEINNDYFTIERSVDGLNFEEILNEKGAGNSTVKLDYRRYDERPELGYNYYRLTQTDFNGQKESFNVEVVNFRGTSLIDVKNSVNSYVYPNPTEGSNLTLQIDELLPGDLRLEIWTANGKLVRNQIVIIESEFANFQIEVLNGKIVASGAYYLKVLTNEEIQVLPFIVK